MLLEINARGKLTVRHHYFPAPFPKQTLLYASDLHLSGWTDHIVQQLITVAQTILPDLILLGGDMVDSVRGFPALTQLIEALRLCCPVCAISGNHETYVGVEKVRACVETAQGVWLDGNSYSLTLNLRIDGFCLKSVDATAYSVLCAHEPDIFPQAADAGYQLVLAGHLHGSQAVLLRYSQKMYPGAWFFEWNGDEFHRKDCTMLVSRGVNDTLPIRWNCPREILVCTIGEA